MRIYCCTPKNFCGDEESFFSRDSGLFCRTLQSLGVESRPILLLPHYPQDSSCVLRATFQELCDPAWWRSLHLDGLIFYSWAAPQYNAVAKAVHVAGIRAIIHMDTCGLVSRLGDSKAWWLFAWRPAWAKSRNFFLKHFSLAKFLVDTIFLVTPRRRLRHLDCGHAITLPTRQGVIWMKQEVSRLGRPDLVQKIFYSPHPQKMLFQYDNTNKENLIVCVARFLPEDWPQKRPELLLKSLNAFLAKNPGWKAYVVGRGATRLAQAFAFQPHLSIRFVENLVHQDLVALYQKSKIGFWASLWEGQQGAAAQAMCCGCSVVASASPLNNCFADYVALAGGHLADKSMPEALADALGREAAAWQLGRRNPQAIAKTSRTVFGAEAAASRILKMLDLAD